jgi:hypothetical protein
MLLTVRVSKWKQTFGAPADLRPCADKRLPEKELWAAGALLAASDQLARFLHLLSQGAVWAHAVAETDGTPEVLGRKHVDAGATP